MRVRLILELPSYQEHEPIVSRTNGDSQWQVIQQILEDQLQRWHSLRTICNAILWINYTGVQWRELAKLSQIYPPWQTVYYHFRQFKRRGVWEQLLDKLVIAERKRQDRQATPSLLAIDSQSIKIMQFIQEQTGIDGNKCINGRKRNIAVDQLGLPWSLAVTSANTSDNEAGRHHQPAFCPIPNFIDVQQR